MTAYFVAAFFGSLAASLALTPIVCRIARRIGFVDKPDSRRKLHTNVVALGGGLAVLTAVLSTSVVVIGGAVAIGAIQLDTTFVVGLFVAAVLLTVVGVIDDSVGMRGRYKLAGQLVACLTLMAFGLRIDSISVFHLNIELGLLAVPITLGWMLGTINAINLLDGADGLVSSVGGLLSLTVAALLALNGCHGESLLAVALAGALLGFLRYNLPPASIYQGDTGSMLIGLVIGALTVHGGVKGSASIALAAPLCIMAIPAFDTLAALTRRKLTGGSLFTPDRGHFHHTLLHRGCTISQTVLIIVGVCFVTCLGAVVSLYFRKDVIAIGTMTLILTTLVACRVFGHVEFSLVLHRLVSAFRWWSGSRSGSPTTVVKRAHHLYGSRNWNDLWAALTESAETFGLIRMELRILLPSIHESFYAVWSKANGEIKEEQWSLKSPLSFDGQLAGNLVLVGHSRHSAILAIGEVADFLEPIEGYIRHSATGVPNLGDAASRRRWSDRRREAVQAEENPEAVAPITVSPTSIPSRSPGNRVRRQRLRHPVLP